MHMTNSISIKQKYRDENVHENIHKEERSERGAQTKICTKIGVGQ
jgi:hypothetical protein